MLTGDFTPRFFNIMKRFPSIKKNEEFRLIYKEGRSAAGDFLVMYAMSNDGADNRIGISVSKKVGNSIVRHRCTRLLRECFRNCRNYMKDGYDIVVVVRAKAADINYSEMCDCYMDQMRRLNIAE